MCRFIIAIVIVWRFLLLSPLFAQYVHPFHATQSHDLQNEGVSFLLIPFMPDPQTNEPDISSVQIGLAFDMDKIRAPISKNDNFSKFLAFPPFSTEVVPSILESLRFGSPVQMEVRPRSLDGSGRFVRFPAPALPSQASKAYLRSPLRTRLNNIEYFSPNFEGLVLGCIDADFCK